MFQSPIFWWIFDDSRRFGLLLLKLDYLILLKFPVFGAQHEETYGTSSSKGCKMGRSVRCTKLVKFYYGDFGFMFLINKYYKLFIKKKHKLTPFQCLKWALLPFKHVFSSNYTYIRFLLVSLMCFFKMKKRQKNDFPLKCILIVSF